jgi:uncharacterized protein (DUF1684 family)
MKKSFAFLLLITSIICFSQQKVTAENFQKNLNLAFADSTKSPLTEKDRLEFKALDFFLIDSAFVVEAQFKKSKNEKSFEMKTTTERAPLYVKYGEISFAIKGENFKLNVYQNIELIKRKGFKNHLFLPFSDLTSGNETYIGGRYIDLEIPKGRTITIDFNQAYNPYCAYNYKYSCPLVPLENDLMTNINAGVKKFHD